MRVGVMAALLISMLMIIAGALLVPRYIFLTQSVIAKQEQLSNVEAILSSTNEPALSAHLTTLSEQAAKIAALGGAPSASALVRSALAVPRPGISLSNFGYTRALEKVPGTLKVSGIASTRDALREYQIKLRQAPFAAAADLPVSAYAKDANIAFVITITLLP